MREPLLPFAAGVSAVANPTFCRFGPSFSVSSDSVLNAVPPLRLPSVSCAGVAPPRSNLKDGVAAGRGGLPSAVDEEKSNPAAGVVLGLLSAVGLGVAFSLPALKAGTAGGDPKLNLGTAGPVVLGVAAVAEVGLAVVVVEEDALALAVLPGGWKLKGAIAGGAAAALNLSPANGLKAGLLSCSAAAATADTRVTSRRRSAC